MPGEWKRARRRADGALFLAIAGTLGVGARELHIPLERVAEALGKPLFGD